MRLLASLLTILSLVTPALAVDPKSVPVLIRDCVTKVDTKTSPPIGAAMTRSNHPCWRVDSTSATKRVKVYGSTLVNGNFTLYQYNLEDFKEVSDCDFDAAEKRKTLKTWTNIGKGKCIEEIGLAFDWAPADRYIGKFSYLGNGVKDEVVKRAATTCEDVVDLPQYAHFGEAIKADFCGYERTKFVEWGNNTVSNCWYEPTSRTANRTSYPEQDDCSGKRTCDPAYRYNTCTKSSDVPDNYYYWMTFGGPIKTGAADQASHVSIFTIVATLVMAFYAQL